MRRASLLLVALCTSFAIAGCNGSGGGGSGGSGSGGGGSGGCPASEPERHDDCDPGLACSYTYSVSTCDGAEVETKAFCGEHGWQFLEQASCAPLPAGACDPVGVWHITETGPFVSNYDPNIDPNVDAPYGSGPFELRLTLEDNNNVYLDTYSGYLSADGCQLHARRLISHSCFELSEESFCDSTYQDVELDFSTTPAVGTVTYEYAGEFIDSVTAPIEAAKQP